MTRHGPEALAPAELLRQGSAREQEAEWGTAARLYLAASDGVREQSEIALLAAALNGAARVRRLQCLYEEAEELAELCWRIAEAHELRGVAARAVNGLANVRYARSEWAEARELYEAALRIAQDVGDDELIGFASQNLGILANIRGDLHEARTLYLEGIASTVRSGNRVTAAMAYNNLGMVCTDLQEWLEATLHFQQGIELAERLGHRQMVARLHANGVEPLIHLGQRWEAHDALHRAERIALDIDDHETRAIVHRMRAVLSRLEGDLDSAERELESGLALATEWGLELERAEGMGGLATLRRAQGRAEEATRTLREARERFAALGAERDARRLDQVLAEWERQGVTAS